MRLVCPNCGAQYEIDDKVIPDSGRDVQCSGCGHAWYQLPAGHPGEAETAAEAPTEDRIAPDEPEDDAAEPEDAEADVAAAEDDAPERDRDDDTADGDTADEDAADEDAAGEGDEEPGPQPAAVQRPLVDDEVRDILKAEAAREMAERAREGQHEPEQVETQPDLGIDRGNDPDEERRRLARERMARMRGIDLDDEPDDYPDTDATDAAGTATARRDLFPDIEEINSTLDSRETPPERGEPAPDTARRGGFGRGFLLVILLTLIAVAIYVFTPQITARLPAAEPALTAYAETVDKGRLWLEDNVQALIGKLEEMAAPEGDGGGTE